MTELIFLSATQLAKHIHERKYSATEVLDAHLSQIAMHNPVLNAIVTLDQEGARQRAKDADAALMRGESWGPLHGVPVTIKDTFETDGLLTTSSYAPLAKYIPKKDATVVKRLRDAGAIILGKTNMPELARDAQCNSPLFGLTKNPWDLARTPGGSTGGGAAAVASGLSPLDVGSDYGGSIRLPAHYCGVFGLKPTEHLVSDAGHIPGPNIDLPFKVPQTRRPVRHMNTFGPLARSVEDLSLCLTLISGPDGRDWKVPKISLGKSEKISKKLRFAWTDEFSEVPVTSETHAALQELVKTLSKLGHHVERKNPPGFDFDRAWHVFGEILGAEVGVSISQRMRVLDQLLSPLLYRNQPVRSGRSQGFKQNMDEYFRALTERESFIALMEEFLEDFDVWLCPVTPTPALEHRPPAKYLVMTTEPVEVGEFSIPYGVGTTSYTSILNLTGNPVVAMPFGSSKEDLPIGVQIVGKRWADFELLSIAGYLSEVFGPLRHPPGF